LPSIVASSESGGLSDNFQRYFPSLKQLIYSGWGYGPIISNAKDGDISMQIGIAQWLAFGLSLIVIMASRIKKFKKILNQKHFRALLGYGLLFSLSIFFMLDSSIPFWSFATKFIALDFPFRLLIVSVFSGSVMAALAISNFKNKKLVIAAGMLFLLVALYTNRNHRRVNMYTQYALEEYVGAETTTNTYHEYLPLSASMELLKDNSTDVVIKNNHLINKVEMSDDGTISLHQFAFPGVLTRVDDQDVESRIDEKGRIQIDLSKGVHKVEVGFQKNNLIKFSELLSLSTLAIITLLILQPKKRNK